MLADVDKITNPGAFLEHDIRRALREIDERCETMKLKRTGVTLTLRFETMAYSDD